MKAVFDTKPTSIYDDDISRHYQFPRRYLSIVEKCIDDWIVLRRPRADGGNLAYFATAKVIAVQADPNTPGMSYARLSDFLAFDELVRWRTFDRYAEEPLRNIPQQQVGVYLRGRSVRPLSEADFANLIAAGIKRTLDPANSERLSVPSTIVEDAIDAVQPPPAGERNWRIEKMLTNRIIRDASFRGKVYDAYDNRCAVTRLRILDAKGNSEVHAAHIWAVADGGPDVVQNGLALSATVHWLFDRHLISLTDNYELLVADTLVPIEYRTLFAQFGDRIQLPVDPKSWPHPSYLSKHRELFLAAK
ncbi:HNH endonuclease [Afipia massiliensis]|uniref:HNH endonuclease n=1 Tax=Afipia massiliensis TaxID=211460 RepID=A0A4U6BN56_9BRAD|nr:HNH endonuclease [Afipia massiliensis]TKT70875.1 HNH endonuclease [Afipia massiliensis]